MDQVGSGGGLQVVCPGWGREALIFKLSQEEIAEGQKRVKASVPRKASSADMVEPYWVQGIKLQGLSGAAAARNHQRQTFRKGDQAEIKAGGKTVKVACQEVLADSVLVVIAGLAQPRELKISATFEKTQNAGIFDLLKVGHLSRAWFSSPGRSSASASIRTIVTLFRWSGRF